MSTTAPVTLENPFPGLRPFREDEEHLFFGRESQVDRMVDKLAATRFLAVVGTSGSGKSSLVNCGIKPALHRGLMAGRGTSWRIVTFRPGGSPLHSMARAFASEPGFFAAYHPEGLSLLEIVDATLNMSSLGLADLFEYAHFEPCTNLLVVVDQFEELFRYGKAGTGSRDSYGVSGEAVAFVNLLLEAHAHPEYPIYIVLTMRSDFLGECSQFDGLPEVINEGQYLVPRLTREERRSAIAGPIGVVAGDLSPVLLTRLINDVGDNPDQLSILQHAVNRTWACWQNEAGRHGPLSLEYYEAVGTMASALDRHAEEAYAELANAHQRKICERVFKALTDKGTDARGIRRPMPLKVLCEVTGAATEEILPVLAAFRAPDRSFLMPPISEPLEPDTVIDISHEILMRVWERLKTWADEEAQSASTYRRLAESAQLHALGKEALWRDPGLQAALEWRWQQMPNRAWARLYHEGFDTALKFLDASKQVRDAEKAEAEFNRRWKKLIPVFGAIAFVVFLALSFKLSESLAPFLKQHIEGFVKPDLAAAPIARQSLADALAYGFCGCISAVISILLFIALNSFGKRLYRRVAYAGIARGISARPPSHKARSRHALSTPGEPASTSATAGLHELVFANFWRRSLTALVDAIVSSFLLVLVMFFLAFTQGMLKEFKINLGNTALGASFLILSAVVVYLYQTLLTSLSPWSATVGALICGIAIRTRSGARPGFGRISGRFVLALISISSLLVGVVWIVMLVTGQVDKAKLWRGVPFVIFGAGVFLQFFTPRKQALYDLLTGTIVIRRRRPTAEDLSLNIGP